MKEYCGLSYKKGKSRPFKVNITKQKLLKVYFSVKVAQKLSNYKILIEIDKTTFSRDIKITHSWLS